MSTDLIIINWFHEYLMWFKVYEHFLFYNKILILLGLWLAIWIFALWGEGDTDDKYYTDSLDSLDIPVFLCTFLIACIVFIGLIALPFVLPIIIFVCIANTIINFIIERL